jgi:SAM-dependent methyltransferase
MAVSMEDVERVVEGEVPAKVMAEHRARYAFAAAHVAGRSVLDVACGSGYGSRMLRDAGAATVLGVDRCPDAVAYARQRYETDGLRYATGDACDLTALGQFDVIVSFETLEHLPDAERFLAACRQALQPDGTLLVSSPYRHRVRPDGRPLNPFHVREWRTEEFHDLLKGYFRGVTLYGQVCRLAKGWVPLPRGWAIPVAALRGVRLKDPAFIYPLPGPGFLGLWQPFPGYLLAVCREPRAVISEPRPLGSGKATAP